MSGSSRRSIFSPGKSGMGTKRPPWTVLHRWRSITVLRISAAAGEAIASATKRASGSAIKARTARLGVNCGVAATLSNIVSNAAMLKWRYPLDWPPARDGMQMTEATPDLKAVTQVQQKVWSEGDFAKIGNRAQIVGEHLCETVDLLSVERVLDVACGSGNTALAAARRFAEAVGVDYVPE